MMEFELMDAAYRVYVALLVTIAAFAIPTVTFGQLWQRILALPPLQRTAGAVLANWILCTAFAIVTGVTDGALWFLLVDSMAARIVLHQPAARSQAIVGAVYMAQILMHVVYLVSDPSIAEPRYWQVLIALAFVQLIVLGGWTVGHLWKRSSRRRGGRRSGVARAHADKGMAE